MMAKSDRFKHATSCSCVIDGTPWSHARISREAKKAGISSRVVYARIARGVRESDKLFRVVDPDRQQAALKREEGKRKAMADAIAALDARKKEIARC